jgi:hypothetical protein
MCKWKDRSPNWLPYFRLIPVRSGKIIVIFETLGSMTADYALIPKRARIYGLRSFEI